MYISSRGSGEGVRTLDASGKVLVFLFYGFKLWPKGLIYWKWDVIS